MFVSTKQVVFAFGIESLPSTPVLADTGIAGAAQELFQSFELRFRLTRDRTLHELGDETRQALALGRGCDARLRGDSLIERDRYVLHDTISVLHEYRVFMFLCQGVSVSSSPAGPKPFAAIARCTLFWKLASLPAASSSAFAAITSVSAATHGCSPLAKSLSTCGCTSSFTPGWPTPIRTRL